MSVTPTVSVSVSELFPLLLMVHGVALAMRRCVTDNSGISIYGLAALEREMSTQSTFEPDYGQSTSAFRRVTEYNGPSVCPTFCP